MFYLEVKSDSVVYQSKKQNNWRAYPTKSGVRNIISITVSILIQTQNLDLSEFLSIDYPDLKDFQLFLLQ